MSVAKKTTRGFEVVAKPEFIPENSDPSKNHYFFAYTIEIRNQGAESARLLNRHWVITDGLGRTQEVRGAGVVGKQPHFGPGDSFVYTSFCPLPTPSGNMRGTYEMVSDPGETFTIEIPLLILASPSAIH